ncbi:MAG: cytochrome P450 [Deinococcaceae bacterium]
MIRWPPIWFFPRFALEHTQIGNRSIPAGSMVILCPLATHRDPRFWEQPDEFNPCNRTQKHRLAFYPFGAGVRKCLGEHFGFTEMQTVFSVFSKRLRFDLTASTDFHLSSATTLWPKRGLLKVRAWNP